jgi:hypothetical protein
MGVPSRGLPPDRWSGGDGDAAPARKLPDPPVEPSWPTVLATTGRLWLERRGLRRPVSADAVPRSAWRRFGLLGLALVVFAAGALTIALIRQTAKDAAADPAGPSLRAATAVRDDAAAWIVKRVSPGAIVACDPFMCSVLQKRGFPAGSLLALGPSAGDPLGSAIVVATAALRSQFGRRLTGEYAPVAIAGFGSGSAGIQVLVTAQDGAASYLTALHADLRARRRGGTQLLGSDRIGCSAAAAAALSAGRVDARLLMTLPALAHQQPVQVLSFGGAAPGANRDIPLSTAELAIPAGPAGHDYLRSALALLRAQRAPLLASSMTTARLASGRTVLFVGFAAPSPLGLLGLSTPAMHTTTSEHAKKSPARRSRDARSISARRI